MAADGGGDEVQPMPSLDGLAASWESCESIRDKLLLQGKFLSWPSPKTVGVINFESMAQNFTVVMKVLEVWCPQVEYPKTVCIDEMREQVGGCEC